MNRPNEKQKVERAWFEFFRSMPGFPVERQAELHAEFMAGYDGVQERREAARREAERKAAEAEKEAA